MEVTGGGVWDGTEASLLASQLCGPVASACQRLHMPETAAPSAGCVGLRSGTHMCHFLSRLTSYKVDTKHLPDKGTVI